MTGVYRSACSMVLVLLGTLSLFAQAPPPPAPTVPPPVVPPGTPPPAPPAPAPGPGGSPPPGANTRVVDAVIATLDAGPLAAEQGVSGISLSPDRARLYVAQSISTTAWNGTTCFSLGRGSGAASVPAGSVRIFDLGTMTKVTDLPLAQGFPIHVQVDPRTQRTYVVASPYGAYAFEGAREVAAARLGGSPHDIGIDSELGTGLVTNSFETNTDPQRHTWVSLVDLATLRVIANTNTNGFGPHKVAVDTERHLGYVSHAEFANVDVVDMRSGALVRQIPSGMRRGGAHNAIDLARRRFFMAGQPEDLSLSNVARIDLDTERVAPLLTLPYGARGMRVDPDTGLLWVSIPNQHSVTVVDPDTMAEIVRVPVGRCPFYLDIDPVRRLAYVTNEPDDTVSVVDMKVVDAAVAAGRSSLSGARRWSESAARSIDSAASAVASGAMEFRALADQVIDVVWPGRVPLQHSLRERLARAHDNFLNGRQRGVPPDLAAAAVNALLARRHVTRHTTPGAIHAHRESLRPSMRDFFTHSGEMSPLEALFVVLSLAPEAGISFGRSTFESETSDASWLAHALLTDMGVRR